MFSTTLSRQKYYVNFHIGLLGQTLDPHVFTKHFKNLMETTEIMSCVSFCTPGVRTQGYRWSAWKNCFCIQKFNHEQDTLTAGQIIMKFGMDLRGPRRRFLPVHTLSQHLMAIIM